MEKKILVTGASGNLGREVVTALLAKGYVVRAASRDTGKIQTSERLTVAQFDYVTPDTFDVALDRVSGIFLVAPPMDPEAPAKLLPFIEKAKTIGVEQIVFNSALGVDQVEQAPLRVIERALIDSGIAYTILRPNFFMENFSTGFIAPMIKQQNGIFLAADGGKTSFISTRDVASVAAVAFEGSLHGEEYNLTGPEALDRIQAARIISEAIGREITYQALPEEVMLQGARDQGMPEGMVQYMGILYAAVRAGYTEVVTGDVEKIIGKSPISFEDFVKDNTDCWT